MFAESAGTLGSSSEWQEHGLHCMHPAGISLISCLHEAGGQVGDAPVKRLECLKLGLAVRQRAVNTPDSLKLLWLTLALSPGTWKRGSGCWHPGLPHLFCLPTGSSLGRLTFSFPSVSVSWIGLLQSNLLGVGKEGSRANIIV